MPESWIAKGGLHQENFFTEHWLAKEIVYGARSVFKKGIESLSISTEVDDVLHSPGLSIKLTV